MVARALWLTVTGVDGDGVDGARVVCAAELDISELNRGWLGLESPTVLVRGPSDSVKNLYIRILPPRQSFGRTLSLASRLWHSSRPWTTRYN